MRIIIFGDSIAWGACDDEAGGWVTRLRNKYAAEDISFYNCGISADSTDELLARFKTEATARSGGRKVAILFAIGINDSQYSGAPSNTRVKPDTFISNLESLVSQAKEFTDSIFFIGLNQVEDEKLTPIPWSNKEINYSSENVHQYDGLIKEVAEKHGVPFLSIWNLLVAADLEDGLHPNSVGHEKLAEAVEKLLKAEGVIV
ncbi:MAG: GDSL-type esterase/lipase family protein [Patescibacteria group bacterium]